MFPLRLKLDVKRLTGRSAGEPTGKSADPSQWPAASVDAAPYPAEQWEAECFAAFGEGRDPAACPDCSRTGFFGPRIDTADGRYRQCRFCGFTQPVGEPATRFVPTTHDCATWPTCARAPYIWWVPSDVTSFLCPYCAARLSVDSARITAPFHDPTHPWWRVPQRRSRRYYLRFWDNWEVTKGRVHL